MGSCFASRPSCTPSGTSATNAAASAGSARLARHRGGLVSRSACHYGEQDELRFTDAVRHVFCLGAPHLGADLEKGVNALGWAFTRLPETRALGSLLNARSVGIKDLRFGSCVEEDWCDCGPDEFLRDRCREVPFLPEANYYFIAASLGEGPLGSLVGDLLVRIRSASGRGSGRGRRIPFEVDNGCELSGLTHFDLLNHPAVYDQIRKWIERTPRARAAAGAARGGRPHGVGRRSGAGRAPVGRRNSDDPGHRLRQVPRRRPRRPRRTSWR